jgi:hypothetical protein
VIGAQHLTPSLEAVDDVPPVWAAGGRGELGRDLDRGLAVIRDLSTEFASRYGADRFTATVLANRFRYIVEHVCGRLLTAAFSPILRDFYDFAATLTGPPALDYATPAMSNSIVLFTGTMTDSVRHDQRVRPRASGAGRRDRRQRSLPDRNPRQRPSLLQTHL